MKKKYVLIDLRGGEEGRGREGERGGEREPERERDIDPLLPMRIRTGD